MSVCGEWGPPSAVGCKVSVANQMANSLTVTVTEVDSRENSQKVKKR